MRARRPVARLQALTAAEKARLLVWLDWTQEHLASKLSPAPDAFNLGLNDGPAAGQTIAQFHFHVIPRYTGDVHDPRGGIRHIIPSKANCWDDKPIPGAEFFTRFDSAAPLSDPRKWTGNDDIHRHYHSLVDLKNQPLDLTLFWKTSSGATTRLIGHYRFDLLALQKAGYIRNEKSGKVRVRFIHTTDDQIYLEPNQDNAPRLLVGNYEPAATPAANTTPGKSRWSKGKPHRDGLYWCRNGPDANKHLIWFETLQGKRIAIYLDGSNDTQPDLEEYYGPIRVPEPEH